MTQPREGYDFSARALRVNLHSDHDFMPSLLLSSLLLWKAVLHVSVLSTSWQAAPSTSFGIKLAICKMSAVNDRERSRGRVCALWVFNLVSFP